MCVQLFLREIQVPQEFLAAKEKGAPRVIQDLQEYQDNVGPEGKLEAQEFQVWDTFGGLLSWWHACRWREFLQLHSAGVAHWFMLTAVNLNSSFVVRAAGQLVSPFAAGQSKSNSKALKLSLDLGVMPFLLCHTLSSSREVWTPWRYWW